MHICDHHIKVYYNIEKRKLVKIEIEIYKGGQKLIGGTKIYRGGGPGGDRKGPVPNCTLYSVCVQCTENVRE